MPRAFRREPSSTTSLTYVAGRISQRPVRRARRSDATGSPLASIGQPKNPQNPQLLQAGRPSYSTLFTPVGARYGWYPSRAAASLVRTAQNMSGPGGIGYGPDRHAANGLAVWSPATPTARSASV